MTINVNTDELINKYLLSDDKKKVQYAKCTLVAGLHDYEVYSRTVRSYRLDDCSTDIIPYGTVSVIYKDGRYGIGISIRNLSDNFNKDLGEFISAARARRAYNSKKLLDNGTKLNSLDGYRRSVFERAIRDALYEVVSKVMKRVK